MLTAAEWMERKSVCPFHDKTVEEPHKIYREAVFAFFFKVNRTHTLWFTL